MSISRTTIYLSATDRHALAVLQARYGLATMSDALRLAVRLLVQDTSERQRLQVATLLLPAIEKSLTADDSQQATEEATTRKEVETSEAAWAVFQEEPASQTSQENRVLERTDLQDKIQAFHQRRDAFQKELESLPRSS